MSAGALLRCTGCQVRRWVRFATDGRGHHVEVPDPCKCTPAAQRAQPIPTMAKPHADKPTQEKIREYVASRVAADHTVAGSAVAEEVRKRFGVEISDPTFYTTYWTPLRKGAPAEVPAAANGAKPPINRIAEPLEEPASRATPPHPVGEIVSAPAEPPAITEENRSLRVSCEAGAFLRVEEEEGGWRLRMNLSFSSCAEAFRAVGALMTYLESPHA